MDKLAALPNLPHPTSSEAQDLMQKLSIPVHRYTTQYRKNNTHSASVVTSYQPPSPAKSASRSVSPLKQFIPSLSPPVNLSSKASEPEDWHKNGPKRTKASENGIFISLDDLMDWEMVAAEAERCLKVKDRLQYRQTHTWPFKKRIAKLKRRVKVIAALKRRRRVKRSKSESNVSLKPKIEECEELKIRAANFVGSKAEEASENSKIALFNAKASRWGSTRSGREFK